LLFVDGRVIEKVTLEGKERRGCKEEGCGGDLSRQTEESWKERLDIAPWCQVFKFLLQRKRLVR